MKIRIKKYTIPFYNNKHNSPYGALEITTENKTFLRNFDLEKQNIYIINSKKYKLSFTGSLYRPSFELKAI